jgi:hypothetical protein
MSSLFLQSRYIFFAVLGLELRAYTLNHSTRPIFVMDCFWDRVSWTVSPGWLQTEIFLISASWVTRITGMSHWCLASKHFYSVIYSTLQIPTMCVVSLQNTILDWTKQGLITWSLNISPKDRHTSHWNISQYHMLWCYQTLEERKMWIKRHHSHISLLSFVNDTIVQTG